MSFRVSAIGGSAVVNFGGYAGSTSDVGVAIAAAVAQLAAGADLPRTFYFPEGIYTLNTDPALTDVQELTLLGDGADHAVFQTSPTQGTVFKRTSGSGGALFSWVCLNAGQSLRAVRIQGIAFDANNLAATGLLLSSIYFGNFIDIHIANGTTVGLDTTTVAASEGMQGNLFQNLTIREREATNGIGMRLSSVAAGQVNTSGNLFLDTEINHNNGVGYQLIDADSNVFVRNTGVRATGTGVGLELQASNTAFSGHARSNWFYHCE